MLKSTILHSAKMLKERRSAEDMRRSSSLQNLEESFFVMHRVNEVANNVGTSASGRIL